MALTTTTAGIFQGDVVIRFGLLQGIKEIRANPDLLDYCFAFFPQDILTMDTYGQGSVDRAKDWFKNTDLPVKIDLAMNQPKLPVITVGTKETSEAEATLGDVHYDPNETYSTPWNPITPVFSATYNSTTGSLGLPTSITAAYLIFPGMIIVDAAGGAHTITGAVDENTVTIETGLKNVDFGTCVLKYSKPSSAASLESLNFKGTFTIGLHVQGEPEQLLWLKSIIEFVLLRYKQYYFEARGFERQTYTCSPVIRDDENWGAENIYSTYINFTGYYKNYWPKVIGPTPQAVILSPLQIANGGVSPGNIDINNADWVMDQDVIDGAKRLVGVKNSSG